MCVGSMDKNFSTQCNFSEYLLSYRSSSSKLFRRVLKGLKIRFLADEIIEKESMMDKDKIKFVSCNGTNSGSQAGGANDYLRRLLSKRSLSRDVITDD